MKKIFALSILLACALQATWATEYDFSAVVPSGQTLYFHKLSPNTVEIVYPSNYDTNPYYNAIEPAGDLVIPSTISYNGTTYQITALGNRAFCDCDGLTSIVIPSTVTMLDVCSISKTGITSITIPSSVTTIANSVFVYSTSLQSVTIDNAAASIDNNVFNGCSNLRSVDLGNSITSIGYQAFYGCGSLTSLTVPNTVTEIANNAFSSNTIVHYCGNATGAPWSARYAGCTCEEDGFVYGDDTKTTLIAYIGAGSNVTIPNSVTSINKNAFDGCSTLTNVTIPNSVTSIGNSAFRNCENLTSVTIGNSVTTIGSSTFDNCDNLTSVTIGKSVTSIGRYAFRNCSNLGTVYNLSSSLSLTTGTTGSGYVANYAHRVIVPTTSGTGANTLYKIPEGYSVVTEENGEEYNIPRSAIPTNFLYKNNDSWLAKEIVLTDDSSAFVAPVEFTAETATYVREFTNSNRSTLYLPFAVAEASMPQDLEVYDFSNFNGSSLSFTEHEGDIAAYTPYLVGYEISSKDGNTTKCTFSLSNVTFPVTPTSPAGVTINDMTFKGTTQRTCMTSSNYGYRDGFFVQSADGSSSDHGTHAHVNPFRAYFTYTPSSGAPQNLPPTLNVEFGYGDPVGIEAVEMPEQEYDGRYGKDVYDMMGRLVRKNADNLQGLPRGIYIWKGKKVMNYEL